MLFFGLVTTGYIIGVMTALYMFPPDANKNVTNKNTTKVSNSFAS